MRSRRTGVSSCPTYLGEFSNSRVLNRIDIYIILMAEDMDSALNRSAQKTTPWRIQSVNGPKISSTSLTRSFPLLRPLLHSDTIAGDVSRTDSRWTSRSVSWALPSWISSPAYTSGTPCASRRTTSKPRGATIGCVYAIASPSEPNIDAYIHNMINFRFFCPRRGRPPRR